MVVGQDGDERLLPDGRALEIVAQDGRADEPGVEIAGERDFWSQPVDRDELSRHPCHVPELRLHVVPDGTHFIHHDRPAPGRDEFLGSTTMRLPSP